MYKFYDFYGISNQLLQFHEIFYKFWTVGHPVFTDKIPTAAVAFDKKNGKFLQFLFNPKFWDYLDNYERCYVIAHECLHVILNHGIRARGEDKRKAAIAIDIIVNHILTSNLGLKLTPRLLEGCHFQTVFKEPAKIPKNKSYEFYYNYLKEHPEEMQDGVEGADHGYLMELDIDGLLEHIFENQNLSKEQKAEIKEKLESELKKAGTESLDNILDIHTEPKRHTNFRWEVLMRKIVKTKMSKVMREYQGANWVKENRRSALLPSDVMLPLYLNEKPEFKYEMWFFQDVSGSTVHLASKFRDVALAIPEKIFDVKFFTFDTATREVDLKKGEIRGGGGTEFSHISTFIENKIKKDKRKYPSTCVMISDGEGTPFSPQFPENWLYILTHKNLECLPPNPKYVLLDEF